MDIICRKLANGMIYGYHAGRFWRWDDARNVWKESHLMAAKFERARAALKTLTPEVFFSDGAEFAQLDEYEIPLDMAEALKNAKPCKNAPIDPVKEETVCHSPESDSVKFEIPFPARNADAAATTAESAADCLAAATPTTSESGAAASGLTPMQSPQSSASAPVVPVETSSAPAPVPSFDYSGLPAQTVDTLHMAENQYAQGKKMTETGLRWMVNAVSMAHDALCSTVVPQWDNGQFAPKEDTFRAWCESLSISKTSAYRLLSVAEKFGSIEIDGKSILDVQPATLLYEAAKPSAPAELVQKVTTGQITSSAEYRAVLKENQQLRTDRVNAMNQAEREKQRAENALAEIGERDKTIKSLLDRSEEADARVDSMESKYKAALADVQGLTEKNSHLQQSYEYANEAYKTADAQRQHAEAERDKAESRAKNAEDALKKQPIAGVIDEEEVDRRAAEKAWGLADARNAELSKDNAALKKELAALRAKVSDDAQADFETANFCINSIRAAWDTSKAAYSRLTGEDLEGTFQSLCGVLNSVMEEASLLCRQPPEYDGGEEDE